MSKLFAVLSLLLCTAGCVNINHAHLLPPGTKVQVSDVTQEAPSTLGYLASIDHNRIRQDITASIENELRSLNIETTRGSADAAKLNYRLNYISLKGGEFEIGYFVSLDTKEGQRVFGDQDEKQDSTFEGVIGKIARRVASYTDNSIVKPQPVVVSEKQKFNTEAAPPVR